MPAQSIKVVPPEMLAAADAVAAAVGKAATPNPGTVPQATPGSPADGAWAEVAADMFDQSTQMTTALTGKGPQVLGTTASGAARLEGQDADNAGQIQAVPGT